MRDQNLVNQVSLGENARSKPLKSCQKRQLKRSKPREWCSLPLAESAHSRLRRIKTSYMRGHRPFFHGWNVLKLEAFREIDCGSPKFCSRFLVIFWWQNRDIGLVNQLIPVRKERSKPRTKRYIPRTSEIKPSSIYDTNLAGTRYKPRTGRGDTY